jgi:NAD(P)-dependent dehydrogenase (short-subunit alcohol dehydrogenase family)
MNVVVIGASRGLGEKLCLALLKRGHRTGIGLRSRDITTTIWKDQSPPNALFLHTDVRDAQVMDRAAKQAASSWGAVDTVVNVAGVLLPGDRKTDLLDGSLNDFNEAIQVNTLGIITVFRGFYSLLKESQGTYIAITSEAGTFFSDGKFFPQYSVSKTAANKVIQSLVGTRPDVRIIAIHPGRMDTDMGHTTAQIQPEETAEGICRILEGEIVLDEKAGWFFDYLGRSMPI